MGERMVGVRDFLTENQLKKGMELYKECKKNNTSFAKIACAQIIEPNIDAINQKLKQQNSPMFLAYALEYVLSKTNFN